MKIAYLGPKGSFTEKIAEELFSKEKIIPLSPIRNVVMAVESGKADFGIVPIENFYNGEVRETLDTLTECSKTKIVGEKSMKVIHCLGALPAHREIKKILSKDQALEQCSRYLCENYPNAVTIATPSTSEAVETIVRNKMLDAAAIASEKAIKDAKFKILDYDLCPNNKTRFAVIGKTSTKPTKDDKTLIVIHPKIRDRPGILYNTLKAFAEPKINLESIQSRPDGKKGYYFYIELDGHQNDEQVKKAIQNIKIFLDPEKKHADTIKILGSYKNSHWKDEN